MRNDRTDSPQSHRERREKRRLHPGLVGAWESPPAGGSDRRPGLASHSVFSMLSVLLILEILYGEQEFLMDQRARGYINEIHRKMFICALCVLCGESLLIDWLVAARPRCVSVVSHPGLRRFAERVCVHGVPGIGVVGPSARFALRRRLGRRALRPAAPGTVQHRPARCHRRGGLCRPGGPARADGPGRLPADPRRPAPCRGRLPGRLPRAARKARSIRDPDLLGNWLYGVALCTRAVRPAPARPPAPARGGRNYEARWSWSGLVGPGRIDGPAGRTAGPGPRAGRDPARRDQPLAEVVPPAGGALLLRRAHARRGRAAAPLSGRHAPQPISPARDKLRRGLTRRGVVLPAAALAAVLEARPASASVSSPLCDITTRAALNFAAGQAAAPAAMALAQEVLRSMLLHNLKLTAFTLLFLGAVATGAGFVGQAPVPQAGKPDPRPIATKPDDAIPKPAPGRMFVVGRVLDANGKPVPGATVAIYARSLAQRRAPRCWEGGRSRSVTPARTARAGSGSMRPVRHRRATSCSAPSPWHRAMVPAGSSSTPTTISPAPTSRSGRSKWSTGDCLTCKAGRSPTSRSRSR